MTKPPHNIDPSGTSKTTRRAQIKAWRALQILVCLGGVALLVSLVVVPTTGLHLLWHVLIPVAPALFVFAPGVWRNICPLGYASLLPGRLGLSRRRRLSPTVQGFAVIGGVVLLLTIAPLRHVVLNTSGVGSAVAIAVVGLVAISAGFLFERKSGWCAGLCPVYPVESLYGQHTSITTLNAHCAECQKCVSTCPESRGGADATRTGSTRIHQWVGTVMTGGFVGFVWGWFQVPDAVDGSRWEIAGDAYLMCLGGFAATLAVYLVIRKLLPSRMGVVLSRVFAAGAVSCYYWYALPTMVGLGANPAAGIVDLSGMLPASSVWFIRAAPIAVFLWWLGVQHTKGRPWMSPPPMAQQLGGVTLGMPSAVQSLSISASGVK